MTRPAVDGRHRQDETIPNGRPSPFSSPRSRRRPYILPPTATNRATPPPQQEPPRHRTYENRQKKTSLRCASEARGAETARNPVSATMGFQSGLCLGIRTPLILFRLTVEAHKHQQPDTADHRNKTDEHPPAALADVMQTANAYGQTGHQHGQTVERHLISPATTPITTATIRLPSVNIQYSLRRARPLKSA